MTIVKRIDGSNMQQVVDSLRQDVLRHVFAFYDLQFDPQHTMMHAAFEAGRLLGYILTYLATDVPSVVLECDVTIAEKLIHYAPEDHFIIHASPNLLSTISRRYPNEKHYVENWMLVKKSEATFFKSKSARQLRNESDAEKLTKLLMSREDRPERLLKKYLDWISKMPLFGVFENGDLVSYAGSFIQLPQVWMIGGVYTDPKHRSKGHATQAVSAVTEEALKKAASSALFVRSDNCPAIRVYEKIGYKNFAKELWVDVGTGLKP